MKNEKSLSMRKKKVKVDVGTLLPAIVDGKVRLKKGGKVVFERTLENKPVLHEGELISVEKSIVTLWDETRGQSFSFDVNDSVKVYALSETDLESENHDKL